MSDERLAIECILIRKGGTLVELGSTTYHFAPQDDGRHIAQVADEDHVATFLAIPEAYRLARRSSGQRGAPMQAGTSPPPPAPAPVAPAPVAPAPASSPTSQVVADNKIEPAVENGLDQGITPGQVAALEAAFEATVPAVEGSTPAIATPVTTETGETATEAAETATAAPEAVTLPDVEPADLRELTVPQLKLLFAKVLGRKPSGRPTEATLIAMIEAYRRDHGLTNTQSGGEPTGSTQAV